MTFTRRIEGHRPVASRPGWRMVSLHGEGFDATGAKVIEFDSEILLQAG